MQEALAIYKEEIKDAHYEELLGGLQYSDKKLSPH